MKIVRLQNPSGTLLLPALLSLLATGQMAYSATLVWTNTLGGNWSVAANWNPNQVPGSADTAQITTSGRLHCHQRSKDLQSQALTVGVSSRIAIPSIGKRNGALVFAAAAAP